MEFTEPAVTIGPYPSWSDPDKIVAMDPWGHLTGTPSGPGKRAAACDADVQPSIAVSECQLQLTEVKDAINAGRLKVTVRHAPQHVDRPGAGDLPSPERASSHSLEHGHCHPPNTATVVPPP